MIASVRAALFADRKRPGVWSIGATWLGLALAFGLGIPYVVYQAISGDPEQAGSAEELLAVVLPDQLVPTGIGLFPLFGGAIVVILGALVIGNEFRWGTLHLIFTQRPRRAQVLGGHAVALVLIALALVVATFVAMAGLTALLATVEGRDITWPGPGALAGAVGAGWLICAAHASLGFLLAVVFRNTATAIAVGLVWTLVIENAVSGLALVLAPFEVVQKILLAPSSGALAGALGARSQFEGGTPGVVAASNWWLPVVVLLGYVILSIGGALWVAGRRDVG
ncbi:ABC transporter permease [Micromonospora sp. NPDC092111]|uniref:ABC transporter permease n=1 Tax=Micromonospora sp. NPDC092111 TaxID=3364289 RepID=UPI0038015599